jgi:hypothetical protein
MLHLSVQARGGIKLKRELEHKLEREDYNTPDRLSAAFSVSETDGEVF